MIKDNTVLERLAALEHEQWVSWATALLESEQLSKERKIRWKKLFVPYHQLDEAVKEFDRVWARKVLETINS